MMNNISRRDLLRAGGAVVVSFALGLPKRAAGQAPNGDLGKSLDPHEVDSFLAVHADGSVTLYTTMSTSASGCV
jgi:hypothetical protein